MRFLKRLHQHLSRNIRIDKVYSKTEKDTEGWNFVKFHEIFQIPYWNEHKNGSLKLETQKYIFRNIPTTEFKKKFRNEL